MRTLLKLWFARRWARYAALAGAAFVGVMTFLAKLRKDAYNAGAKDTTQQLKEADDARARQIRDAASRASRSPGVPPGADPRGFRD
jgi:hypothetical protein